MYDGLKAQKHNLKIKKKQFDNNGCIGFTTSDAIKTMKQLTHPSKLIIRGHPDMLAVHKKLISPKPECINSASVSLLALTYSRSQLGIGFIRSCMASSGAAAHPSTVVDFGELIVVETRGVPSSLVNVQYSSCLMKLPATV